MQPGYTRSIHAMEFSVSTLHELEKQIEDLSDSVSAKLNCRKLEDLTHDLFKPKGVTKDVITEIVLKMGSMICQSRTVLRSAAEKLDQQKSEQIKTQNELIQCKSGKLTSVKETVKTEMKLFTDVVKNNTVASEISPAKIKMAVKSAITEDDRSKNFIIFGAPEELECEEQEMSERSLVGDIWGFMKFKERPNITNIERVGVKKSDSTRRPIKVTMRDPEIVREMLSRAKVLKSVDVEGYNFNYNKLYLSPDRSQDERISRQKLVQEMKERIKKDSSKKYYIRNNKVCVAE